MLGLCLPLCHLRSLALYDDGGWLDRFDVFQPTQRVPGIILSSLILLPNPSLASVNPRGVQGKQAESSEGCRT